MPQPSTNESFLLIIGGIFLAIGILGGGFEIGSLKIPSTGRGSRILSGGLGMILMVIAVVRLFTVPSTPTSTLVPSPIATDTPTTSPTALPTLVPSPITEIIALRTYHGTYVTAMDANKDWKLAQTQELKDWEKFTLLCLDDGKVALRTYHGTYVTAMNDEDDRDWKLAQTQELKDWEKFTLFNAETRTQLPCLDALKLFRNGEVNIALRTYHGRYVTAMDANKGWVIRAQTRELKDWEKFTVILP